MARARYRFRARGGHERRRHRRRTARRRWTPCSPGPRPEGDFVSAKGSARRWRAMPAASFRWGCGTWRLRAALRPAAMHVLLPRVHVTARGGSHEPGATGVNKGWLAIACVSILFAAGAGVVFFSRAQVLPMRFWMARLQSCAVSETDTQRNDRFSCLRYLGCHRIAASEYYYT